MKACLVVLNYNDSSTTLEFVSRICDYSVLEHIVVVDNCSTDGSFEVLKELTNEKVDVIKSDYNGGYGYGNNYGIKHLVKHYNPKYIVISNPDVEVSEDTILKCIFAFERNENCAVVAPLMKMPDGQINYKCVWKLPSFCQYLLFSLALFKKIEDKMYYDSNTLDTPGFFKVSCVAGSFLVVDTEKFMDIGLYDENIFLYCEETVLGLKLNQKKYESYVITNSFFTHYHSTSIDKSISSRLKQKALMWKSREYVLLNYWHKGFNGSIMVYLVKIIGMLEEVAIHLKTNL